MLCLMERIGYRFSDEGLLRLALTHPSSAQPGRESNQRLEFLGDAVLQLCASHSLYLRHPQMHEGELSRLRAALVQESSLHRVALAWQLGGLLRLGPGEESSGGRDKPSILADAVEAVPHTLPALWRAEKIQSKTAKAGFDWTSSLQALDKLEEEVRELRAALEAGQAADAPHGIREELGDTLFMAAKIAQMSGVDPEDALHRACDKFDRRFRAVEEAADKPLPECGEAELLALWNDAKSHDPS